jgi:hypothetical protein
MNQAAAEGASADSTRLTPAAMVSRVKAESYTFGLN